MALRPNESVIYDFLSCEVLDLQGFITGSDHFI